jgi:uncharacterized membrane protein YfcA
MSLVPLVLSASQVTETGVIGVVIGLLGGLFGKGGSAVATPLLRLIGLPGFVAVASPLPATAPSTLVAAGAYWKADFIDWKVVRWGIVIGIPATAAGALLSRFTGDGPLLIATGLLVLGFGLSFLLRPTEEKNANGNGSTDISYFRLRMVVISIFVGIISGLLANSGGFLLAPLYARFLKLHLKTAFACSLVVSAVLAIPGTAVHWYLGHISWPVALIVAVGSVPFAYLGARLAIRTNAGRLERIYGLALTVLGAFFVAHH